MWTTGQLASAIEISLKLAMSVLCACQVSSSTDFSVLGAGVAENKSTGRFFSTSCLFCFSHLQYSAVSVLSVRRASKYPWAGVAGSRGRDSELLRGSSSLCHYRTAFKISLPPVLKAKKKKLKVSV